MCEATDYALAQSKRLAAEANAWLNFADVISKLKVPDAAGVAPIVKTYADMGVQWVWPNSGVSRYFVLYSKSNWMRTQMGTRRVDFFDVTPRMLQDALDQVARAAELGLQ